ncbi:hypothetical protein ACS5NO_28155 [Larkinella sp. GY13]|uniref:hypothetical protein n=1 Tax=Larkinella sp. GY13 TaxID=3453720 RepID=UPI003EECA259
MERLQLHKLQLYIDFHWEHLQTALLEEIREPYSNELFYTKFLTYKSKKRPGTIAHVSKGEWSRLQLHDRDVTDCRNIVDKYKTHTSENLTKGTSGILSVDWKTRNHLIYAKFVHSVKSRFQKDTFHWNEAKLDWEPGKTSSEWFLDGILKKKVLEDMTGDWYLYRYSRFGIKRMNLSITPSSEDSDLWQVFIYDEKYGEKVIVFRGSAFSTSEQRTVLLLEDESKKYGHALFFSLELSESDRREVCLGHFTYFSRAPKVGKYLSKSIVLLRPTVLSDPDNTPLFPKMLAGISDCLHEEKLVFEYLSEPALNRLTTISSPIHSLRDFEIWSELQKNRKTVVSGQVTKGDDPFYVFYIKKQNSREKGNEYAYNLYTDKLTLTLLDRESKFKARYEHFKSSLDGRLSVRLNSYNGMLEKTHPFWFGMLLSTSKHPLFINLHLPGLPGEDYSDPVDCYIGSVTGPGDKPYIMVSYTCVVVPFSVLPDDVEWVSSKIEKIKAYLIKEAERGWGVIDPAYGKVYSFKIDEL